MRTAPSPKEVRKPARKPRQTIRDAHGERWPFVTRVEWEPENNTPDTKACFDELVTGKVDCVHIERMSDGTYWMAIYKGKDRQIVTFGTAREAKIFGRTEPD